MKHQRSLLIGALLLAGTVQEAVACSCSGELVSNREAASGQFQGAKAVFEGEVVSVTDIPFPEDAAPDQRTIRISFRVLRAYKGVQGTTAELYSTHAHTSCGMETKAGDQWFVYGVAGDDGKLYIFPCTRTTPVKFAGPDIRYARNEAATLEDLMPPGEKERRSDPNLARSGATLCGNVRRADKAGVSEVFVTVWDADQDGKRENFVSTSQKVNPDGTFEISYLAPGNYFVSARDSLLGDSSEYVGVFGNVSLQARGRDCNLHLLLQPRPLGTVRVRVVAPDSWESASVWLRDVDLNTPGSSPFAIARMAPVASNGIAEFKMVPYGRYDVEFVPSGVDLARPTWTQDDTEVQLAGPQAETTLHVRKKTPDEQRKEHH